MNDPIEPARTVVVPSRTVQLEGFLTLPSQMSGIVLFAHGSGSGRHSPRNQFVASALHGAGLGTLLLDLLAPSEEGTRRNVFDIGLLASRLQDAADWLQREACAGGRS